MLRFHQERGAGADPGGPRGAGRRSATASASCRSTSADRLTGFLEKPKDLPPGQHLASMGIYIFDMSVLVPALEADAQAGDEPRFRQGHHSVAHLEGAGLRLPVHRREQEDDEVLARHRDARRVLRSQHGPVPRQPGVQPLRSGMAGAHAPGAGAAGEVRLRRRGPALRDVARLDDLGRLHHLRQLGPRQRALPERPRPQLLPRWSTAS